MSLVTVAVVAVVFARRAGEPALGQMVGARGLPGACCAVVD